MVRGFPLIALIPLLLAGCASPNRSPRVTSRPLCEIVAVRPWPEADLLFRGDPEWRGGDGAYSIDLGGSRVLWLFGDSFVSLSQTPARAGSPMVRNTIAIQEGEDPSNARMSFAWGQEGGKPDAFFTAPDGEWYWPGHGVRLGDRLLLFMFRVRRAEGGLGFEPFGWTAFLIENPDDTPETWRRRMLEVDGEGPILCSGGILSWQDHVYAYCPDEPRHRIFLSRWTKEAALAGDLSGPEWWTGGGWGGKDRAVPVIKDGQSEMSVHYEPALGTFLEVQTDGFGAADIVLRSAPRPEGRWSEPVKVYHPPESDRKGAMVYSAKACLQQLSGGDLLLVYSSNSSDFAELLRDESLYYPRFVRLRIRE